MTTLRDDRADFYNLIGMANMLEPETELVMLETAKLVKAAKGQQARMGLGGAGGGGDSGGMVKVSSELRSKIRHLEEDVNGKNIYPFPSYIIHDETVSPLEILNTPDRMIVALLLIAVVAPSSSSSTSTSLPHSSTFTNLDR